VERDLDERIFRGIADAFHVRGLRRPIAQHHAVAQTLKLLVAQQGGGFHQIRFGDLVIRIGNPLGKTRIAGEQQKSAGVLIQPPHRDHPASLVFDDFLNEIVNRRPAFGIFVAGDVAGGLVKQQVNLRARFHRPAVQSYFVAPQIHPVIGSLDRLSIHLDAAHADPSARVGARTQSRLREHALQRFQWALARRRLLHANTLACAVSWEWRQFFSGVA